MAEFIKIEHEGIEGYGHVAREALDKLPGWTEVKEEESPEDATVQDVPVEPAPADTAPKKLPAASQA